MVRLADVTGPVRYRIIGLTGGIGSGKSTVGQMLAERGAAVIDADAISRATTATGGAAIAAIAQQFGADFIGADGALDRARMRAEAFARPEARRELMLAKLALLLANELGEAGLAAVDAALLKYTLPRGLTAC